MIYYTNIYNHIYFNNIQILTILHSTLLKNGKIKKWDIVLLMPKQLFSVLRSLLCCSTFVKQASPLKE